MISILSTLFTAIALGAIFLVTRYVIAPYRNPLRQLPGPPVKRWFGNHMSAVLECVFIGALLVALLMYACTIVRQYHPEYMNSSLSDTAVPFASVVYQPYAAY